MTKDLSMSGMSPGSSDSARGSSCHLWNSQQSSSYSSFKLKGDTLGELETIVDDKDTAARAVAFVVQSSRKGIIPLCAEVANLIKAKKRLENLVEKLQEENARLKLKRESSNIFPTSCSTTPSPPSIDSSDCNYPRCPSRGRRKTLSSCSGRVFMSPCSSSSTLTSHGDDEQEHYNRTRDKYRQSRKRCVTRTRRGIQEIDIGQALGDSCDSDISIPTESELNGSRLFESLKESASTNQQLVCVDVHSSQVSQVASVKVDASCQAAPTRFFSVATQCGFCEEVHNALELKVKSVESEKQDLEVKYQRVEQELEQLRLEVDDMRQVTQVSECVLEIENEITPIQITTTSPRDFRSSIPPKLPDIYASTDACALSKISKGFTVRLEDRVVIKGERIGRVRYIGPLEPLHHSIMFVGVHLDSAVGRHDGFLRGRRYFQCPPNHGIFVPVQDVVTVLTSKRPKTASSQTSHKSGQLHLQKETKAGRSGDGEKLLSPLRSLEHTSKGKTRPLLSRPKTGGTVKKK